MEKEIQQRSNNKFYLVRYGDIKDTHLTILQEDDNKKYGTQRIVIENESLPELIDLLQEQVDEIKKHHLNTMPYSPFSTPKLKLVKETPNEKLYFNDKYLKIIEEIHKQRAEGEVKLITQILEQILKRPVTDLDFNDCKMVYHVDSPDDFVFTHNGIAVGYIKKTLTEISFTPIEL